MFKTSVCPIFTYVNIALDVAMKRSSQPEDGERAAKCKVGWIGTGGRNSCGCLLSSRARGTATCIPQPCTAVVMGVSVRDTGCYASCAAEKLSSQQHGVSGTSCCVLDLPDT